MVEHRTFNAVVAGSNPARLTKSFKTINPIERPVFTAEGTRTPQIQPSRSSVALHSYSCEIRLSGVRTESPFDAHPVASCYGEKTVLFEKDLDRALEVELRDNPQFLAWLVAKSKFVGHNPRYLWSRSDNPWCRVQVRLPDAESSELRIVERDGETDILLVFSFESDARRLALHIENKRASGHFSQHQAEVYAARGEHWLHNDKYGNYEDWDTLLLAPRVFYERNVENAAKFGGFVSHEDISQHVSSNCTAFCRFDP